MTWTARVLTLFPEVFPGPLQASLAGKGLEKGLWQLEVSDLRTFGLGKHLNVDDTPFGGGAGMVMRADVIDRALAAVKREGQPAFYLTPRGRLLDQSLVRELAGGPGVTLLCGRYEGVDERVLEKHGLAEISIGDYVLSGGEMAALVLLDAVVRLLPGVMGNQASADEESFGEGLAGLLLEHPHFTRPADWEGRKVPEVLISGDHEKIRRWRLAEAEKVTKVRRPDLWARYLEKLGKKEEPR